MKRVQRMLIVTAVIAAALLPAACNRKAPAEPAAPAPAAPVMSDAALQTWLGPWMGPEGTSLTIGKSGDVYTVTVRDLDRTTTYRGTPVADGLQIERRGQLETLHETDGAGTGMKWLADKHECLTLRAGDGYCRR